jgi:hypothetical protein
LKYGPTGDRMTLSVVALLGLTPRAPSVLNMKGRMYMEWPGRSGIHARSSRSSAFTHSSSSCGKSDADDYNGMRRRV